MHDVVKESLSLPGRHRESCILTQAAEGEHELPGLLVLKAMHTLWDLAESHTLVHAPGHAAAEARAERDPHGS